MNNCFECGAENDLTDHHPVPAELGGTKTIKLCPECMGKVRAYRDWVHGQKIRAGIERARAQGRQIGARRAVPAEVLKRIHTMQGQGMSNRAIAKALNAEGLTGPRGGNWYESTIRAAVRRYRDVT